MSTPSRTESLNEKSSAKDPLARCIAPSGRKSAKGILIRERRAVRMAPDTAGVSVSVPVSFAVFIFVAGVAVRFFSVERFAVPFVAGVGSGFFRQVFLVAVSVAFLFLLFQGSIETGNTVLPQDILRIAFGRLRLGIGFERDRLHAFLVHVDHIEGAVGWDCNQVGRERFIGRVGDFPFEDIRFKVIIGIVLCFQHHFTGR